MEMGSAPIIPVEVIPSGSIALDHALGIGGLPRGRIVEIYGPEQTGKTTLALHAIANVQRAGGHAVMIDAEHALDMDYAHNLGVDTEHLLLNQPDTGEQGLEMADMVIRSGVIDVVVIDSVAALVPRAEIEGEMGASHIGLQARLMSQALRKLTGAVSNTRTTLIFINQLREKVGVVFGNPEVTTGGKALKFYASVRLDIRRKEAIKEGAETVGHTVRIKVVKNKMAPPFKECLCDIIYGIGISRAGEIVELGVTYGVIRKAGAWYYFPPDNEGAQGKEAARAWIQEHTVVANELERQIRERMAASPALVTPSPSSPLADPASLIGPGSLADLVVPRKAEQ
jgi:recombination protein RecA